MNTSSVLLGATGFLLVLSLVLALGKMNRDRNNNPDEVNKLRKEINELSIAYAEIKRNKTSYSPSSPSYLLTDTSPIEPTASSSDDEKLLQKLQAQVDLLKADNADLRNEVANVQTPAPEPIITEPETTTITNQRPGLIEQAILQATILGWDSDYGMAVIDPGPNANFSVGQELGLRRNNGILCRFTVTGSQQGRYIADLKPTIDGSIPEILVGDELIIPPAFDGKPD